MRLWKIPGPILRLAVLFVLAIVALILARARFVPATFGDTGHYRDEAVVVNAGFPVRYAGLQACVECHVEEGEVKQGSYHRGLTCEGCHGAARDHAEDPTAVAPQVPGGRAACLRCHEYRASRPTGFAQIIENLHNPMEACAGCHDPHDPTPPETPGECSACHAEIARTKSVSHHWSVDCEVCHEAQEQHKIEPRLALPTKPREREFCGACHADDPSGEVPQVDLAEHGGRYLCWQCHYPHHPEGK